MKTAFSDYSPVEKRIVHWLLAIHIGIALGLAMTLDVTAEEAHTLSITSDGLVHALRDSVTVKQQPPVFVATLAGWRQIAGHSIFAARLLSIGFSWGLLLTLALVSRQYLPRIHAPRLVAVAALHPFAIWAAATAQPYSLILLLSTLQLLTFYEGFLQGVDHCSRDEELRRCRWRVAFLVLSVAGLYSHFATAILLVTTGGILLIHNRWRSAFVYAVTVCLTAACFAPMAFAVFKQTSITSPIVNMTAPGNVIHAVVAKVGAILLPTSHSPTTTQHTASAWAWSCLAIVIPGIVVWKFRAVTFWRQHIAAIMLLVGGVMSVVAVDVFFSADTSAHTAILFLPALLASFVLAAAFGGNRAVGWWSCAVVCFSLNTQLHDFATPSYTDQSSHTGQIQESLRPTQ